MVDAVIQGKGVSKGIAIAPARRFHRIQLSFEKRPATDIAAEVARFEAARAKAAKQLGEMAVRLGEVLGKENSLLFEIHQMMLEDLDYQESVEKIITGEGVCAEYAVAETARRFADVFAQMDDEYMQARATDVKDVSRRVLEILSGVQQDAAAIGQPAILVSDDFSPSETVQFDRSTVRGLVTTGGSSNSHTAIFARTMGIPAIIGVGNQLDKIGDGNLLVLDGESGKVHVSPSEVVLAAYREQKRRLECDKKALEAYRGRPARTNSGKVVKLFANIGSVQDAQLALENDAEGIGLFRSEFLYLESEDYPSEDVQYKAYRAVVEKMEKRQVVIRTLDIGADKQAAYFKLPSEENPALGMRAIRVCLTRPEVFKTQLRALYRASIHGDIAIMLPMITSVEEVRRAKAVIEQVKSELGTEGIPFRADVPVGIMVETPAAAIISDLLAQEVDFFSIGTNDLTQYTLAVDRMNDAVSDFCDEHHEAILRLIETVAKNAHEYGIWVGICGELAADEALTRRFVEMEIDELSVAPANILQLRRSICEM